jgi:O-antigen ligase
VGVKRGWMLGVVEGWLILCVTAAVLAFGGTEPVSFAVIEVVLLGGAGVALFGSRQVGWRERWRVGVVPGALVGVVALQLVPFPARVLGWLRPGEAAWKADLPDGAATGFSVLSVAPHNTRAQLIVLVCCVIAYFFAGRLGEERGSRRRLVAWLLVLGTFEAAYGLVQYLSGWQRIFVYAKKYNLEEATGTYINRNHFAGFLEMVIPFGLALVLYEHSKSLSLRRGRSGMGVKAVIAGESLPRMGFRLFALIVMIAGLLFSRSRMGIMAGACSLVLMAAVWGLQRKAGLWIAGLVMACVAILVLWIGAGSAFGRFGSIGNEFGSAEESRLSIWRGTVRLIGGHPLLGSGLGTFPVAFTAVQSTFLGKFVNHAHNDYLEIASDVGIPAAILLFGSIVLLLRRVVKTVSFMEGRFEKAVALGCLGSIVAILLHSVTDFNLYIPANALAFSVILGLAATTSVTGKDAAAEARG